jgi:hypothetical protein
MSILSSIFWGWIFVKGNDPDVPSGFFVRLKGLFLLVLEGNGDVLWGVVENALLEVNLFLGLAMFDKKGLMIGFSTFLSGLAKLGEFTENCVFGMLTNGLSWCSSETFLNTLVGFSVDSFWSFSSLFSSSSDAW